MNRYSPDKPRLPPGQVLSEKWPVLHHSDMPTVTTESFRLRLFGAVARPAEWTWDQLRSLPPIRIQSDFHCVTTWSTFDNDWEGVSFQTVAERVGPLPSARHVVLHASDGYTTNVPLRALLDDDVLLAWAHGGQPLSAEHGGPLRLVVPKLYAWKSAKWLSGIEVLERDRRGFWEERGYHNRADPWLEERFSHQETGAEDDES